MHLKIILVKHQLVPNKINKARHIVFNINGVKNHMKKRTDIVGPKFSAVIDALENNLKIMKWVKRS